MTKSTKTIIIAAALTMLSSFPLYSASIEKFQTEEYYASNLDLINAAEAYSKGYTGKGITIGINDTPVNLEHESFVDKTGSKFVGSLNLDEIDWSGDYLGNRFLHGSHVGGIAAGSKNGKGMHGVAFDAEILSSFFMYDDDAGFATYNSYPEIKTINNSWNLPCNVEDYFVSKGIIDDLNFDEVAEDLDSFLDNYEFSFLSTPTLKKADAGDTLLIFANGNEGKNETGFIQFYQWLKGESTNNLISITSVLNTCSEKSHLDRDLNGSITGDFLNAPYTNLAKYFEDNVIAAPGWNINSSLATDNDKYVKMSGTSMAAPFVTGGAALVQQAFPYMNSKQIGDVLLSTANNNISLQHSFGVLDSFNQRYDDEGNPVYDDNGNPVYDCYVKLFYLDERTNSSDEEIMNDLLTYKNNIKDDMDDGPSDALVINLAIEQGNISVYYQTPIQEFVGQGILDVGKAVSGPGALNARRLGVEDLSSKYLTDKRSTLMYSVDTKGYDSEWENDIKEIRVGKLANDSIEEDLRERYNYYNLNWISNDKADVWAKVLTKAYVDEFNNRVDESGLEGLHVGLIKSGEGILKLNGNNTYKGATVVTDGAIAINGSVAGDAYSEDNGVIMGKGRINGTLYNNNIAIAGDGGEGNLTMNGLESKGTLTAVVNNEGNTKFVVNGKANVDGTTVKVQGLVPGESYTVLSAENINGQLVNNKENSTAISTFMNEYAAIEGNEIKVISEFSEELNSIDNSGDLKGKVALSKRQKTALRAMKNMYFKLMSDLPEGVASYRTSIRTSTTPQQMNQIMTLINLPAAQAGPALSAVVNNAAAQSMTLVQRNSMTGDILSSHFSDRFREERIKKAPFCKGGCPRSGQGDFQESNNDSGMNSGEGALKPSLEGGNQREGDLTREKSEFDKEEELPLITSPLRLASQATSPQGEALGNAPRKEDNSAWFKFAYNKGEMRDGARYHGRSGIIGYDLKLTDTKSFGLFFGHGNNTLDGFDDAWAKNKIEENKFGVYASKKNDKASGYLYLDYGKVDNELNRTLTNLDLSTNVKYKGNIFEIGGEYKLTPKSQKNKTWKVYPYINLQFSRYKQDGYHEKGGGIFNQVVESKTNNYAAGQLGLEFNFSNEKENYVLRLAGKTAFSGYEPKLTYSFEGDMASRYEMDNDQDKSHMLVSFKGERKISTNTLLSADLSVQRGSHDRNLKASLSFWKRF